MNLSFVFMAFDFGRRFGVNKLYVPLGGKPLYRRGLECLMETAVRSGQEDGHQVRLVVVSQYWEIPEDGERPGLEIVYSGASDEGVTVSLRLGTEAEGEDRDIFLFFVADQPYMKSAALTEFACGFIKSDFGMGRACSMGKRGNPAVFSRLYRERLLSLRGDKGGSVIMKKHSTDVWSMEVSENELKDIDVQADSDRKQEQLGKMQAGKRWNNKRCDRRRSKTTGCKEGK